MDPLLRFVRIGSRLRLAAGRVPHEWVVRIHSAAHCPSAAGRPAGAGGESTGIVGSVSPQSSIACASRLRAPVIPAGSDVPDATVRRMRIAMGTFVAIEAAAPSETIASSAIEAAFAAIAEVEQRMHPSRAGSAVARINSAPLGVKTLIDPSTAEVLTLAARLSELTDGVFDPCLPIRPGRLSDLELGGSAREDASWAMAHAPLAIDLGGIAKGYAIDRAVEALKQAGCLAGIVNAGGDLRAFGALPQTVLLRRADRSFERLLLDNAAIGVSDFDEARRPPEHRGYYDGSVARTEAAVFARRHAAVLAGDAMSADALTKCVLLCQEGHARRALSSLGGRALGP